MKLSELIPKRGVATATVATLATVAPVLPPSVATVASVAVAKGETEPTNATISKPLSRKALHSEAQRQKVIKRLNADPNLERAILTDTDSDPQFVILSIAVRSCNQTCEMQIDKATYDPWALLELIETCGTMTH